MSKLTEAQMLREYLEILKARERVFIKQFRELLNQSDLTINEAKPFYELLNSFENEHHQCTKKRQDENYRNTLSVFSKRPTDKLYLG